MTKFLAFSVRACHTLEYLCPSADLKPQNIYRVIRVVLPRAGANRFRPIAGGVCPSWNPHSPRRPHSVPPPPPPSRSSRSPPPPLRTLRRRHDAVLPRPPGPIARRRAPDVGSAETGRRRARGSVPGSRGAPDRAPPSSCSSSTSTTLPPRRRRIGWRRDVVVVRRDPTVPPVSPPAGSVDAMGFARLLLPLPLPSPPSAT
jgi:hypothetical protein